MRLTVTFRFRLIATLLRPRNSFVLRKRLTSAFLVRFTATFRSRFASKFLVRFTATFLSRFTATFLLRLTEEFRSRAVADVVDAGRAVGVFTATSRRARNSCFLWGSAHASVRSWRGFVRELSLRSPVLLVSELAADLNWCAASRTTAADIARPKHYDARSWSCRCSRALPPERLLIAAAALLSQAVSPLPLALLPL